METQCKMIDTKELRIGNIVLIRGKMESVYNVQENSVNLSYECGDHMGGCGSDSYDEAKDIEPVPITPELLIEFGFIKKPHIWRDMSVSEDNYWFGRYNIGFEEDYIFLGREQDRNAQWLANIQYAHQLQNIYFNLSGKELEINQ